jgi:hypothetical protein
MIKFVFEESVLQRLKQGLKFSSVANIHKVQTRFICGHSYPAKAINCL